MDGPCSAVFYSPGWPNANHIATSGTKSANPRAENKPEYQLSCGIRGDMEGFQNSHLPALTRGSNTYLHCQLKFVLADKKCKSIPFEKLHERIPPLDAPSLPDRSDACLDTEIRAYKMWISASKSDTIKRSPQTEYENIEEASRLTKCVRIMQSNKLLRYLHL